MENIEFEEYKGLLIKLFLIEQAKQYLCQRGKIKARLKIIEYQIENIKNNKKKIDILKTEKQVITQKLFTINLSKAYLRHKAQIKEKINLYEKDNQITSPQKLVILDMIFNPFFNGEKMADRIKQNYITE